MGLKQRVFDICSYEILIRMQVWVSFYVFIEQKIPDF